MRLTPAFLTIATAMAVAVAATTAAKAADGPGHDQGSSTPLVVAAVPTEAPAAGLGDVQGWTAGDALQVDILKDITNRKRRARDEDVTTRLDELGTLYATEFRKALWVNDSGLTERAHNALAELRRADEWGLTASEYDVREPATGFFDEKQRAAFEVEFTLNVLKYVDHARRGRFRPTEMSLWYERAANETNHVELLRHLAETDYPGPLLVAQHPQQEGFKLLHQAYLRQVFPDRFTAPAPTGVKAPEPIVLDAGDSVRRGQRHPQIAMLRERLKVPAATADDVDLYDADLMNAVNGFMRTQGWRRKYVYDNKVRKALNGSNGAKKMTKSRVGTDDLVANMEKWRWLPRELGDIYVWNNLPSFKTQVIKDNRVIHEERIIIGKSKTQTPVFSDVMTHVVFKPQWGVPNSIKIRTLLPRLASGDLDVLRRRGMQIQYDNKVVSPSRYNWSRTDIKSIPIVMGAGSSNPLGRVKFMFPNHHDVYMHDTPDRHLFNSSQRTFSYGCIRVRDPIKFAEVILGETTNWTNAQVAANLASRAKDNNRIDLDQAVGVHNTYFTVIAAADGKFETLPDIYGHDKRIKQAIAGKSLTAIASGDPARIHKREIEQLAKAPPRTARRKVAAARRPANNYGFFSAPSYVLGGTGYYAPQPKKQKATKKKLTNYLSMNPMQRYFQGN